MELGQAGSPWVKSMCGIDVYFSLVGLKSKPPVLLGGYISRHEIAAGQFSPGTPLHFNKRRSISEVAGESLKFISRTSPGTAPQSFGSEGKNKEG